MSGRALSIITASLVLMAATAATAASAPSSPLTPKLGLYESSSPGSSTPEGASVTVVKTGKSQAAKFSVLFKLTCGGAIPQAEFNWVEESPIPIKNGKFAFNRAVHPSRIAVVGGSGRDVGEGIGTTRLVVSGTFKSATEAVVKTSAAGSYDVHYFDEEQPNVKVECTGKQTATAKFKHR